VGAVAGEDVVDRDAVALRRARAKTHGVRIGIQSNALIRSVADRRDHARRRGIRILVGVELDDASPRRGLLTRNVRGNGADRGAKPVARTFRQATGPPLSGWRSRSLAAARPAGDARRSRSPDARAPVRR